MAQGRLKYQPGLDGLRALAVILVLLFHAGVSWMRGGFHFRLPSFSLRRSVADDDDAVAERRVKPAVRRQDPVVATIVLAGAAAIAASLLGWALNRR